MAWNLKFFILAKKPTQPKQMTTNILWAGNDLESMMLFLSISVYLAEQPEILFICATEGRERLTDKT